MRTLLRGPSTPNRCLLTPPTPPENSTARARLVPLPFFLPCLCASCACLVCPLCAWRDATRLEAWPCPLWHFYCTSQVSVILPTVAIRLVARCSSHGHCCNMQHADPRSHGTRPISYISVAITSAQAGCWSKGQFVIKSGSRFNMRACWGGGSMFAHATFFFKLRSKTYMC